MANTKKRVRRRNISAEFMSGKITAEEFFSQALIRAGGTAVVDARGVSATLPSGTPIRLEVVGTKPSSSALSAADNKT